MAQQSLIVPIQRLSNAIDLPLPQYQSEKAAAMDLCAAVQEPLMLGIGMIAVIPCGIAIAIPEGFEGQVRPRSGLAAKEGVTVLNTPGTIDADYRGEVKVCLVNHGDKPFQIIRGFRIAQLLIAPVPRVQWEESEVLPESRRGTGGFGHTGAI